ncbi:hypothetical protein [Thiohalocapsa marina]|uniref:hypothetical protein n=1 Tax=Thiohalocapsa marina TaxID=424902 RepID=UPI0036DB068B
MILKAIIEDQEYTLNVPDAVLAGAGGFFDQLDRDMDQGWQMSRDWVDAPTQLQRCQIIADKLLSALEKENHKVGMLMAGYILDRLPAVESVELDIAGEIQNNHFNFRQPAAEAPATSSAHGKNRAAETQASQHPSDRNASDQNGPGQRLSRLQAMTQAGNDVTKVFKVGKAWRFSVYDAERGGWQESPLIASEQEAERLRQAAVKQRYEALVAE